MTMRDKDFTDKWAFALLGTATIGLIIILIVVVIGRFILHPSPTNMRIEWKISHVNDSTHKQNYIASAVFMDSLQSVLSRHEQHVTDKIEHIIETREREDDTQTAIMLICGFCISIFAFFGYKSFKDIKNEAIEISKDVAIKSAAERVKENLPQEIERKFQEAFDDRMRQTIQKEINDRIPPTIKNQVFEIFESLTIEKQSDEPRQNPEEMFERS